jgi:hypothetical protein
MQCKMLLGLGFTDKGTLKVLYESAVAATRWVESTREQPSAATECWSSATAECWSGATTEWCGTTAHSPCLKPAKHRSSMAWTKHRCTPMLDCGSEGALGQAVLVSEELAPGMSYQGRRVGGKGQLIHQRVGETVEAHDQRDYHDKLSKDCLISTSTRARLRLDRSSALHYTGC